MVKINIKRIALSILVGILTIGLFLPTIVQFYTLKQLDKIQPVSFIPITDEKSKQKLFLLESVNYDYAKFKLLSKIIELESNWKVNAMGDGGKAFGLAQFHQPTFNQFKEKAGMSELEYKNPYHQITLMVWAFENNLQSHWTTYKRAKKLSKI